MNGHLRWEQITLNVSPVQWALAREVARSRVTSFVHDSFQRTSLHQSRTILFDVDCDRTDQHSSNFQRTDFVGKLPSVKSP